MATCPWCPHGRESQRADAAERRARGLELQLAAAQEEAGNRARQAARDLQHWQGIVADVTEKRDRLVQLVHDAAGLLDDCGTVTGEDDAQRLRAEADNLR